MLPRDALKNVGEGNASVSYQASMGDNRPLPNWIKIDPATGTITATPPSDARQGEMKVQVTAKDSKGNTVSVEVTVEIGRRSADAGHRDGADGGPRLAAAGRPSLAAQIGAEDRDGLFAEALALLDSLLQLDGGDPPTAGLAA
jgi:hypothetical protein